MFRQHPLLSLVTFVYLGVVGWLTLGPQPIDDGTDSIVFRILAWTARHPSLDWVGYAEVEFAANVAMFVPIGLFFLLLFGRRRWWIAVLLGVALTITIETVQLSLPDRVSDPRDLVANSVGALIGVIGALIVTTPAAIRLNRERTLRSRQAARATPTGR